MRRFFAFYAPLLCLVFSLNAAVPPAEKLLPDDTLLMFTMPDFNQMRSIYATSPHGRLLSDPAMKPFRDKFMGKLSSDYIEPLEKLLGVHFADYTNLAQGQVTVALVQDTWTSSPITDKRMPAILLLVDTKDKSAQLKTNLADLSKKWVDAGKSLKTEKIRDVDFTVVTVSSADFPKPPKKAEPLPPGTPEPYENPDLKNPTKSTIYIGQVDSLLIVGTSEPVIEKTMVRMSGGSLKSLSDATAYGPSAGMFRDAPMYGWVNTKTIIDLALNESDEDSVDLKPFGLDWKATVKALGLAGLRTISFDYHYSNDGSQFDVMLATPETDRTGLFKILAGEAKDCNPPPFVPADAVKFQRWRIDGQKSWATIRKIASDISPAAVGFMDFSLQTVETQAKEKDPNFDINKYLFANLGDDMISYEKNPRGDTLAALNSPPSIMLIGSPNAEQLTSALQSVLVLYSQQAAAPKDRDFLGHKIHSIPLPGQTDADGSPRSLNYAASGGYVAISTDNAMIEEYLRSAETPPKALRDMPGLDDATQKVSGPGTSLFGFANEKESMRMTFGIMKKDPAAGDAGSALIPITTVLGMSDIKSRDWIDVSLLPDFDAVAKYFYISVYGLSANADGLTFKAFAPTPPELKK